MLEPADVIKERFPDVIISCNEHRAPITKLCQYHSRLSQGQKRNSTVLNTDFFNVDSIVESSKCVTCKRPCLGRCNNEDCRKCGRYCRNEQLTPSLSLDHERTNNDSIHVHKNDSTPIFLVLHAAIENRCNALILQRVFDRHSDQAFVQNSSGMLPLHIAASNTRNDNKTVETIQKLLSIHSNGAAFRDVWGRLPLHIALRNEADYSTVKCLLDANEAAGFRHCLTADVFRETPPIFMAAYFNCGVDVLYLFLRGDPSVVQFFRPIDS